MFKFYSIKFSQFCFVNSRFLFLWAWGYLVWLLLPFIILHFVFFEFLLTLGSLRVFNLIFSTLGDLGFIYLFGMKFGGLWFWSCEHPYFWSFNFWKSKSFQFSSCHFRGLHFIFSRGNGVFGFHFVNSRGCFVFIKKVQGSLIFFLVILWVFIIIFVWRAGRVICSCEF